MSQVNRALGVYQLNHLPDQEPLEGFAYPDFASPANPILTAKAAGPGDHVIPNQPMPFDQLDVGTCAANAGIGALELLLSLDGHYQTLSRLHLYSICLAFDGNSGKDAGTYLSTITHQLHKIGVCAEALWSYDPDKPVQHAGKTVQKLFCPPPLESDIRASENRVSGHYRINTKGQQRLNDIATAIRANHPVIFGTQVSTAFEQTDGRTPLVPDPRDMLGGHATMLVGVQTIAGRMSFRDKNSWGPQWADGGYCWLDQDYMTWANTDDIWVMTRMQPLL